MPIVVDKLIEYFEKELGKPLKNKRYWINKGKEGDTVISLYKEKPFILKRVKFEDFYKFLSISSATKMNKFLFVGKVIEKPTYYLVDVKGIFVYGVKKVYQCLGNPEFKIEGEFLKYKLYRLDNREYFYIEKNLEIMLNTNGLTINQGKELKQRINMEEYIYTKSIDPREVFSIIDSIIKEFEQKALSLEYAALTKKDLAFSIKREYNDLVFRAWYCSRKSNIPKICENPLAYKPELVYEQYYQGMKKLEILLLPKDIEIKEK
ncbi:NEQ225 [Nanoarchaeum equitans Kin4-M]|uniref:NEQ225 n=1 Tax=Nanoarchaeum equitans (strain Kin4-M) TaxID=228908 RepID=Q74NE8_NANEQ|nr:NEQ225 [Nanoarchaeum equitans Kin4-M]